MLTRLAAALVAVLAIAAPASQEVHFKTADNWNIFGDLFITAQTPPRPLLLLIHQGDGSAQGDYGPIIPRLLNEGFDVLAIDSRLGGNLFGATNRTVARNPAREWTYCDAYPDVTAALDYARSLKPRRQVIVWGSSYSATLALRLAGDRPAGLRDRLHG